MPDDKPPRAQWRSRVLTQTRPDGTLIVSQEDPLLPWPRAITEALLHWAQATPDRDWLVERGPDHAWRRTTYAQAARTVQALGSALLDMGLSSERPMLILSGNSTAHALLAIAAQHVGVPSAALAPAYALSGGNYGKLRDIAAQLTPGALFADNATPFAPGINAVFPRHIPVIAIEGSVPDRDTLAYSALARTPPTQAMQTAHDAVTNDTVAKFLFTSGTTGSPKAVIQTHGMLCSNQQIVRQSWPWLEQTPPVVVDWAPWNHTASGNKVFNMVLTHGGTYHIDGGRPTPQGIARTIENLRDVSPTWYFNVPLGYQMLLDAFETDDNLRDTFFKQLQMMFYAGAGMSQPVWDRLTRLVETMRPDGGVLLTTGFGATETGPFALVCNTPQKTSGNLGVPGNGVTLKLVPQDGKLEARVKTPSVTPGYWGNPDLTAQAFDDEGFYRFGDALRFAVPGDAAQGFVFDGRLAENFKLASGTWVAVGPLRAVLTNALGGLASDVVIAGEGQSDLGALVVPDWTALREAAGADLDPEALIAHPAVRALTAERLAAHARAATGSSTRVTRLLYLVHPLDFNKGEVTDKGSINQRAVLRHRADDVAALWSGDARVIGMPAA